MADTHFRLDAVWLSVCLVFAMLTVSAAVPSVHGSPTETTDALVVDDNGTASYQSIQAAIDAADTGDTVTVRPGTYEEPLTLDKSVVLTAPAGATLNGTNLNGNPHGIVIQRAVNSTIEGFTVTGFDIAVYADNSTGDWSIRNSSLEKNTVGIDAANSTGDWSIYNTSLSKNKDEGMDIESTAGNWTLRRSIVKGNGDDGIDGDTGSSGDWIIANTTVRDNGDQGLDLVRTTGAWMIKDSLISGQDTGVVAYATTGNWSIHNTLIRNHTWAGVNARKSSGDWSVSHSHLRYNRVKAISGENSTGDWTVTNTTVQFSHVGINARQSSGNWTIRNTSIRNMRDGWYDFSRDGTAIRAHDTSGNWAVRYVAISDYARYGINAKEATGHGTATGIYWGNEDGFGSTSCIGNVTCEEPLSRSPAIPETPRAPDGFESESINVIGKGMWYVTIGAGVGLVVLLGVAALVWRWQRSG